MCNEKSDQRGGGEGQKQTILYQIFWLLQLYLCLLHLKFIFVYCCSIMHHVYCVQCNQCCIHIIQSALTARTIRTIRTPIHTWRLAAWNMILSVISSCFLFCLHNLHKHLTQVKRISISVLCIHRINIYSIQPTIGRTGSV